MIKVDTNKKIVHTTKFLSKNDEKKLQTYLKAGYEWEEDLKRPSAIKGDKRSKEDILNSLNDEDKARFNALCKEGGFFFAKKEMGLMPKGKKKR